MRMQPRDVDARYGNIPDRKRQILKDHLSRIESPRSPPSWNVAAAAPQLPPRPGLQQRAPAPLPQPQDDGDASDDGWGSDDFEDDIDEEYLEPTSTPAHIKQAAAPGHKLNGHPRQLPPDPGEPQPEYEIPAEELEALNAQRFESKGLTRKPTLVDRLKNELEVRKRESQVQQDTPPLPPRPARGNAAGPEVPSYTNTPSEQPAPPRLRPPPPQPTPPAQAMLPPDDVYEIVNDSPQVPPEKSVEKSEPRPTGPRHSGEVPIPPRQGKKLSTEKPPPPPPTQQGGWLFNNEQATPTARGDDLNAYEWYHGKISRDHAQSVFNREQKDGMFLIRKSERSPEQPYTLVIWYCNRIWNIPIRKLNNNKFAAGKPKEGETHFDSLPELVEHFKVVSLNLKTDEQFQGTHNLTVPAPRQ